MPQYKILTFVVNGHPFPIELQAYNTREEAEQRIKEIKIVYDALMFVSEINNK